MTSGEKVTVEPVTETVTGAASRVETTVVVTRMVDGIVCVIVRPDSSNVRVMVVTDVRVEVCVTALVTVCVATGVADAAPDEDPSTCTIEYDCGSRRCGEKGLSRGIARLNGAIADRMIGVFMLSV